MRALTCPCVLAGASTRADGSLSIRLSTPELSSDEKAAFFDLVNQPLKLLLQPDAEATADVKEIKSEFDQRSPSQRLRSVLFVLWRQQGTGLQFDQWYLTHMNKLIQEVKDQLEPEER